MPGLFLLHYFLSEEIRDEGEPREKAELHFPLRLPDNGIWGLGGCHIPLTHPPSVQKASVPLSKGRGVRGRRAFIIPLCSPQLLDQSSYIDPAFPNTSGPPKMRRRIYTVH